MASSTANCGLGQVQEVLHLSQLPLPVTDLLRHYFGLQSSPKPRGQLVAVSVLFRGRIRRRLQMLQPEEHLLQGRLPLPQSVQVGLYCPGAPEPLPPDRREPRQLPPAAGASLAAAGGNGVKCQREWSLTWHLMDRLIGKIFREDMVPMRRTRSRSYSSGKTAG